MNFQLKRLFEIADKEERLIIGLMSGTSLDGLDVALCRFRAHGTGTALQVEAFCTLLYDEETKAEIRQIFACQQVDLETLSLLHPWLGEKHGDMVLECLQKWELAPDAVDLIASHGQTVFHAPAWMHRRRGYGNATLQLGDADHLAVKTGIITLGDFRQKQIAAGGEGAPLAAYGDFLLYADARENRLLLNIGGIANYTFLPAGGDGALLLSTDIGPGNTLIDAACKKYFQLDFDNKGDIAREGRVIEELVEELEEHPFFELPLPKTTGPELFNLALVDAVIKKAELKAPAPADLIASLTAFSARCVIKAVKKLPVETLSIYMSGGGMHNSYMVELMKKGLPNCRFGTTEELGIHPDAKEAVLFAVLANEAVAGNSKLFEGNEYGLPAVSMGKISLPA